MKPGKLVRDNILNMIASKAGVIAETHTASPEEFWFRLKEKLSAEIGEFKNTEDIRDLGDVFEDTEAVVLYKQFNKQKLQKLRNTVSSRLITLNLPGGLVFWERLDKAVADFTRNEYIEKLAEILGILDAFVVFKDFDWKHLERIRKEKIARHSGFKKRIILEEA